MAISIIIAAIIALAVICLIFVQRNKLKSPIEGVSKKVYEQGQICLEKMETSSTRDAVEQYVKANPDVRMNEVYSHIESVDFIVDVGKNATAEEIYYADLIGEFWKSKAFYYAHEAVIAQFIDSDDEATQMVVTLYKGMISDFADSIDEAEEILEKALTIEDMEKAYQKLESIWESEDWHCSVNIAEMKLNMEVFFAVNVCRMNYDGTIINPSKLLNRDMTRTGEDIVFVSFLRNGEAACLLAV